MTNEAPRAHPRPETTAAEHATIDTNRTLRQSHDRYVQPARSHAAVTVSGHPDTRSSAEATRAVRLSSSPPNLSLPHPLRRPPWPSGTFV